MRRGLWDREMVALLLLLALLPLALVWLWFGGTGAAMRLGFTLVLSGGWHLVFMLARAQPPSFAGAVTALAVAMLAPPELAWWQMALGVSFGSVMAELVFGGWGRNVLNPATVTLAFLGFAFPAATWPGFVQPVIWAAIPAVAMGCLFGVMSFRLVLGALVVGALALLAGLPVAGILPAALLCLALLATDPVASATTAAGRWLNGAGFAALVVLFAVQWQGAAPVQAVVSAALLASLLAPLFDEISIALWSARRRRRHG